MACRLDGAKPLPEPMLEYYQLDPREQTYRNSNVFIQENALQNVVCEMASILLGPNVLRPFPLPFQCMLLTVTTPKRGYLRKEKWKMKKKK